MEKSTFTPLYDAFRKRLLEMRKGAGLTQRELAKRIGREHSFVSRVEQGERRVDVVEFYWICKACGENPRRRLKLIIEDFDSASRKRDRK